MSASALLIKALGGGWKSSDLPFAANRTPEAVAGAQKSGPRLYPGVSAGLNLAEGD